MCKISYFILSYEWYPLVIIRAHVVIVVTFCELNILNMFYTIKSLLE